MIAHENIYSGIRAGRKLHYGRVAEPRISVWRIATPVLQQRNPRFMSQDSRQCVGRAQPDTAAS